MIKRLPYFGKCLMPLGTFPIDVNGPILNKPPGHTVRVDFAKQSSLRKKFEIMFSIEQKI